MATRTAFCLRCNRSKPWHIEVDVILAAHRSCLGMAVGPFCLQKHIVLTSLSRHFFVSQSFCHLPVTPAGRASPCGPMDNPVVYPLYPLPIGNLNPSWNYPGSCCLRNSSSEASAGSVMVRLRSFFGMWLPHVPRTRRDMSPLTVVASHDNAGGSPRTRTRFILFGVWDSFSL